MDDWLQPTQNNGTIIHSCSDLRWTRYKCSRVPLINGTMRHRTGEIIRVRRYLQIKYIHMTALHTVLLSASRYWSFMTIRLLKYVKRNTLTPQNPIEWIETKYTYTTKSNKIIRNKVPKANCLTYTELFVCLPEQMLSAPEQFVSLPKQLVCATEQLQNCSGIVRMSSGAVKKYSGTVCKSSGAVSKCSGAVTKVFRSS